MDRRQQADEWLGDWFAPTTRTRLAGHVRNAGRVLYLYGLAAKATVQHWFGGAR